MPGTPLVVDGHMHILDASWLPEGLRRAWARQAAGRTHPERDPADILCRVGKGQSDPDGSLTIAAFDTAGVAAGVMPVVDWTIVGRPAGEHLPIRDLHARCQSLADAAPGRLFFCAGIDPRHPDAAQILEHAAGMGNCRGVKLYPAAGWALADPAHSWLFERLVEMGLPAVVHTSPLGGDPLQTVRSRPAEVAALLARYPTLTVVFAHAGIEAWWAEALDSATGWQRAYLELSLWQRCAFADYAEFRRRVARMRSQLGAHRLVFGSDIIRGTKEDPRGEELVTWIDRVISLAEPFGGEPPVLSAEELALFLAANAVRVFDLRELS
ncbi:amidohydrolase family protein [Streptosporangium sp. NPDC001681]|uniref:amidohydrolase family protein n=1 Tax=Streptosporangium sp. NPDC001681 TaxID=3154395 RepID=UPI003318FCB0